MKRILILLTAFLTVTIFATHAQTTTAGSDHASRLASQSRTLFPHNWVRGYTDFSVAPAHNQQNLGRCKFPHPATARGAASTCTAYARYLLNGYDAFQPLGPSPTRHLFL